MDWRFEAACLSHDPELFLPDRRPGPALMQIQQAKAICRTCRRDGDRLSWAPDSGQGFRCLGWNEQTERLALRSSILASASTR